MLKEKGIDAPEEDDLIRRPAPLDTIEKLLLDDMPKRRGSRVISRKQLPPVYTIVEINGSKAICVTRDGKETVEFDLSELVRV